MSVLSLTNQGIQKRPNRATTHCLTSHPTASQPPKLTEMGTVEGRKDLGCRVVMFPLPYQGHISPMLQLAALLHRSGFSITVLHPQMNSPDATQHPDFHFVPIPDGMADRPVHGDDVLAVLTDLNTNCEAPFRDRMAQMLSESSGEPISCVIVDSHMHSVRSAAEQLGLWTLALRTGGAVSCNVFSAFPLLLSKGYLATGGAPLNDPVSELPPLRVGDLPHLGPNISPERFSQHVAKIVQGIKASSGLILNSFTALEGAEVEKFHQQAPIPVFLVGPLHKFSPQTASSMLSEDRSCMEWLDQQAPRSVLYVSFGSLAFMDGRELIETAWGLADSNQPFLWVIRPGSIQGSECVELPQGFEEATRGRGRFIKWAPQQDVLGHPAVGGFWTHSGWNSTMESISEGIPMLCTPYFGDQMFNARYVSDVWKVGIILEKRLDRAQIQRAIKGLMTEGEEMRDRARDLKQHASRCIQQGGSSRKDLEKLVEYLLSSGKQG